MDPSMASLDMCCSGFSFDTFATYRAEVFSTRKRAEQQ